MNASGTHISTIAAQIDALPSLSETINTHDLAPLKALGQNFLLDRNITDKIVRLALAGYVGNVEDLNAIEVGPGPGGLTRSLLSAGLGHVTAIEFDSRAVAALQALEAASSGKLDIMQADALSYEGEQDIAAPRMLVANLPYNIATPLLIKWLGAIALDVQAFYSMTLMFQKEVADRICARAGDKKYGRLSVISQAYCSVQTVYVLSPTAFTPPPKVDSAVVHFRPKVIETPMPHFDALQRVTAAAFGQSRKMVRTSLKAYASYFEQCGISETVRAENLSVAHYIALALAHEGAKEP